MKQQQSMKLGGMTSPPLRYPCILQQLLHSGREKHCPYFDSPFASASEIYLVSILRQFSKVANFTDNTLSCPWLGDFLGKRLNLCRNHEKIEGLTGRAKESKHGYNDEKDLEHDGRRHCCHLSVYLMLLEAFQATILVQRKWLL